MGVVMHNILSLDGGGSWAIIQVMTLQKLYGDAAPGSHVLKNFDLVVANSGGSIVAAPSFSGNHGASRRPSLGAHSLTTRRHTRGLFREPEESFPVRHGIESMTRRNQPDRSWHAGCLKHQWRAR